MSKNYVTLEQAQESLLTRVSPVPESERLDILDALDRVCAEDIFAQMDQPPFDRSPLDGYALRHEDIARACRETPVKLRVTQWLYAGDSPKGSIAPGEAARIMTGGMLPPGADCVIRQEDTDSGKSEVLIYASLKHLENICFMGEDVKAGRLLITRGQTVNYGDVGVLAGQGIADIAVFRKPRVAVAASGDELVAPGEALAPGKIYNSNSLLLAARLRQLGADVYVAANLGDDLKSLCANVEELLSRYDLVVTTGGVSVGLKDFMPSVVRELGGELLFHGVEIKPGSPALAMSKGGSLLLALSGNPFAAAATFEMLAGPVVRKLSGHVEYMHTRLKAVARGEFNKPSHSRRLIRAKMIGGEAFIPKDGHASGMLSALAGCNCLIDIPAGSPGIKDGGIVDAVLI